MKHVNSHFMLYVNVLISTCYVHNMYTYNIPSDLITYNYGQLFRVKAEFAVRGGGGINEAILDYSN